MIFRLSQKLSDKIKAGTLVPRPGREPLCRLVGWVVPRRALAVYILVTNTKSLYSTVLPGKGVTDGKTFVERA